MDDLYFMNEALKEAKIAFDLEEVPVGAVIVKDGVIIARGHNTVEKERSATRHAEINAIEDASKALNSQRLTDCTLYVTLEPCPMCAGAILNSRIERVVYGVKDEKGGGLGGVIDLSKLQAIKGPRLKTGVLKEEILQLLEAFFKKLR